jgi:hypothetical protein
MLRITPHSSRKTVKRHISKLAMALALVGGAITANGGFSAPVMAQDYSKEFVDLYQPVANVVNAVDGDVRSVSGQFPAVIAAAQTADDKFAVGNLILIAGNKTTNPAWQRQGLELQIASGKVPQANLGQFNWFIGNLAFQMADFPAARAALQAAVDNGWTQDDPTGLIAESYFSEQNDQAGVAYILRQAAAREAAGGEVPEQWLLRGLQAAYNRNMLAEATDLSVLLVTHYNTKQNWINGLQVVHAVGEFDDQARLDLLRLFRVADAMTDRREFIRYIEAADPRIMSNEVSGVLAEGLAAGHFETTEPYYLEVKEIADGRMASDRQEAPDLVAEARTDADGNAAMDAGDVLYSIRDFAGAEEMYALAIAKGGVDTNVALTRLGISQARQGKSAEAQASFSQVSGARVPVARMWGAYAATQG